MLLCSGAKNAVLFEDLRAAGRRLQTDRPQFHGISRNGMQHLNNYDSRFRAARPGGRYS